MALTKLQADAVIRLFVMSFANCDNKLERKKLVYEFENEFSRGIPDWKERCIAALKECSKEEMCRAFEEITDNEQQKDYDSTYDIRLLKVEDFVQIRDLINRSLDLHLGERHDSQLVKLAQSGYSFVACDGDEIFGVLLADAYHALFFDEIYIDTLAVDERFRNKGIAKKLMDHLKKIALSKDVNVLNLQTDKKKDAFQIYKHWGFKEKELMQLDKIIF